jgi:hypothetical protein
MGNDEYGIKWREMTVAEDYKLTSQTGKVV